MSKKNTRSIAIPKTYQRLTAHDIVNGALRNNPDAPDIIISRDLFNALVMHCADLVVDGHLWDQQSANGVLETAARKAGLEPWLFSLRQSSRDLLGAAIDAGVICIPATAADVALHNMGKG